MFASASDAGRAAGPGSASTAGCPVFGRNALCTVRVMGDRGQRGQTLPPHPGDAAHAGPEQAAGNARGAQSLGQFPNLVLVAGAGLLLCSVVEALSRATLAPEPVF